MKNEQPTARAVILRLTDVLGPALVGAVAGLEGPAPVKTWMIRPPDAGKETRLRVAYEVVEMIAEIESAEVALIWMCGSNPLLDDRNPAFEIGRGGGDAVLKAARAYLKDPMLT